MLKILIAEDDDLIRRTYSRMFKRSAHEVVLVENPIEARKVLRDGFVPSVILSDWNMPIMNGGDFCRLLRCEENEVPFIIISAEDRSHELKRVGANEFLLKPTSLVEILVAIDKVMQK